MKTEQRIKETFNLWDFDKCDDRFGISGYPGRIPGQIFMNLLWLYTEPRDWTLAVFGGSGTEIDVAKYMNRKCIAYDIQPSRDDILYQDVTNGIPPNPEGAKYQLIFLDPPYGSQKQYTDLETDFSNMSNDEYLRQMQSLILLCLEQLDVNGILAIINGITCIKINNRIFDIPFEIAKICDEINSIRLIERIIVPFKNVSSHTGLWISRARDNKFLLRAFRDILIYKFWISLNGVS